MGKSTMKPLTCVDEFDSLVANYKQSSKYRDPLIFAVGAAVRTQNGTLASVRYPVVNGPKENTGTAAIIMRVLGIVPEGVQTAWLTKRQLQRIVFYFSVFEGDGKNHPNIEVLKKAERLYDQKGPDTPGDVVVSFIFDDDTSVIGKIIGVEDATLRLYGRSLRLYTTHDLGMSDILRVLPSVVWENDVPLDPETVNTRLLSAAFERQVFAPNSASKIPLLMHRVNLANLKRVSPELTNARLGTYIDDAGNIRYI